MSSRIHYSNIESLRGIASLMVAIYHTFFALTFISPSAPMGGGANIDFFLATIVLIFANGDAAVTIFFILSGVVLGLSLDADKNGDANKYFSFIKKRFFRIYPAHIISLILVFYIFYLFNIAGYTELERFTHWYNSFYRTIPDAGIFIENLLLITSTAFINPPTWTLKVEMAVSVIFPILHIISRRINGQLAVQFGVLFLLIGLATWNPEKGMILPHIYKFYLGLLIPILSTQILTSFPNVFRHTYKVIWLAILIILSGGVLLQSMMPGGGLVQAVGATILIFGLMQNSGGFLFRQPVIKKLGQISYSFYLWHFPIFWLTYFALHSSPYMTSLILNQPFIAATLVCVISVYIAYWVAKASYLLVEHRMILWGRHQKRQVP